MLQTNLRFAKLHSIKCCIHFNMKVGFVIYIVTNSIFLFKEGKFLEFLFRKIPTKQNKIKTYKTQL